jgi:hypothetical protein
VTDRTRFSDLCPLFGVPVRDIADLVVVGTFNCPEGPFWEVGRSVWMARS